MIMGLFTAQFDCLIITGGNIRFRASGIQISEEENYQSNATFCRVAQWCAPYNFLIRLCVPEISPMHVS